MPAALAALTFASWSSGTSFLHLTPVANAETGAVVGTWNATVLGESGGHAGGTLLASDTPGMGSLGGGGSIVLEQGSFLREPNWGYLAHRRHRYRWPRTGWSLSIRPTRTGSWRAPAYQLLLPSAGG